MTVKELIEQLGALDPALPVHIEDGTWLRLWNVNVKQELAQTVFDEDEGAYFREVSRGPAGDPVVVLRSKR